MNDAELYARHQALLAEEWKKATDGHQSEHALSRLVAEEVAREREACAALEAGR